MAFRKKLKGVKKNRHKSAGKRSRAKRRKSVTEKRRLRLKKRDKLLNEYFNWQQSEQKIADSKTLEG